ncbi:MAG: 2-amino-4-hydroxy-6-hydroxymethyldihydropteridine diphosphokinase [Pseudomonadota bacterium]
MTGVAYLGLGSNIGDRKAKLLETLKRMLDFDLKLCRVSSLYESEPLGLIKSQPFFYNAVAEVSTGFSPEDLLWRCQKIESLMGRQRKMDKGPRTIDIDLLLLGTMVVDRPELVIPHPEMNQRAFVLLPLLELKPNLVNPRDGVAFCDHLSNVIHDQRVTRIGCLNIGDSVGGG